jgi:hypothetical protein
MGELPRNTTPSNIQGLQGYPPDRAPKGLRGSGGQPPSILENIPAERHTGPSPSPASPGAPTRPARGLTHPLGRGPRLAPAYGAVQGLDFAGLTCSLWHTCPGPPQALPRPSPGPPQALPRPSPGPPQALPRPSPGRGSWRPCGALSGQKGASRGPKTGLDRIFRALRLDSSMISHPYTTGSWPRLPP